MSARQHDIYRNQCWRVLHGLPDVNTTQDCRSSDERRSNWDTSAHKQKYGVCGVKPCKRMERTPQAHHDGVIIPGTDGLQVFANTQPHQLTPNNGHLPRASAWNQKVLIKPIPVQTMNWYGRSNKKTYHLGSATSLHVPTDGPVDRLWTVHITANAETHFHFLQAIYKIYLKETRWILWGRLIPRKSSPP